MKKVFAFVLIAAAVVAASTLKIEVKVSTNAAYACKTEAGC